MKIVSPSTPALLAAWDRYVAQHPAGWWWHTRGWIDYQLAYRPGTRDLSFGLLDDDGMLAGVVPIVLTADGSELSYAGDPLPWPLVRGADAEATLWAEIERRWLVSGARRAIFAGQPFGSLRPVDPQASPLADLGGRVTVRVLQPWHRVIDLADGPRWADVRHSYRALIHRAQRAYRLMPTWGDTPPTADAFAAYQRIHRSLATHPRADETYRLQGEWLREGNALLVTAEDAAAVWGAAYWYVYRGCAYYGSGAYVARDLAHAVVWASLEALARRGVKRASLGWQGTGETDKERNIELFKRGFGGDDVPVPFVTVEG